MLSKFKVDKPQANVLYKRGPRHFEVEQSVLSLPLLEAYDQRIGHLHEIGGDQAMYLFTKRLVRAMSSSEILTYFTEKARSFLVKFEISPFLASATI